MSNGSTTTTDRDPPSPDNGVVRRNKRNDIRPYRKPSRRPGAGTGLQIDRRSRLVFSLNELDATMLQTKDSPTSIYPLPFQ